MAEETAARVVGIDLGTTNSLVAFMQGDTPDRHSGRGRRSPGARPSSRSTEDAWFRRRQRRAATLLTDSANAVYSAKRLMGRDLADVAGRAEALPVQAGRRAASRRCAEAERRRPAR